MKLHTCLSLSSAMLLITTLAAGAHSGHVDQVDGHSHWLAWGAAALAVVIAAGAFAAWRRRIKANR